MHKLLPALVVAVFATQSDCVAEPVIVGHYIEARTCDVWTGPCFANGEVNLTGDHAILGWNVARGSWNGETLDGLSIVAVVDSEGTLSTAIEGKVRTVIYVDAKATEAQAKALLAVAVELAPKYTKNIVKIHRKKISLKSGGHRGGDGDDGDGDDGDGDDGDGDDGDGDDGDGHHEHGHEHENQGSGTTLTVGDKVEVKIETGKFDAHCDSICGNEERAYPTLGKVDHVECAKALQNFYKGKDLDVRWSDPNGRSAMLGRFSL